MFSSTLNQPITEIRQKRAWKWYPEHQFICGSPWLLSSTEHLVPLCIPGWWNSWVTVSATHLPSLSNLPDCHITTASLIVDSHRITRPDSLLCVSSTHTHLQKHACAKQIKEKERDSGRKNTWQRNSYTLHIYFHVILDGSPSKDIVVCLYWLNLCAVKSCHSNMGADSKKLKVKRCLALSTVCTLLLYKM